MPMYVALSVDASMRRTVGVQLVIVQYTPLCCDVGDHQLTSAQFNIEVKVETKRRRMENSIVMWLIITCI